MTIKDLKNKLSGYDESMEVFIHQYPDRRIDINYPELYKSLLEDKTSISVTEIEITEIIGDSNKEETVIILK